MRYCTKAIHNYEGKNDHWLSKSKDVRVYHFNSTKAIIKKEKREAIPWTSCVEKLHCNLPYHELALCEPALFLSSWSHDWQAEEETPSRKLKDEHKYHFPNPHLWAKKTTTETYFIWRFFYLFKESNRYQAEKSKIWDKAGLKFWLSLLLVLWLSGIYKM